jgi:hypothetical protein
VWSLAGAVVMCLLRAKQIPGCSAALVQVRVKGAWSVSAGGAGGNDLPARAAEGEISDEKA